MDEEALTASAFYQQQLLPLLINEVDGMQMKLRQAQKVATDADLVPKTLEVLATAQKTLTTLREQFPVDPGSGRLAEQVTGTLTGR
ncbi:hypothetical protein WP50_39025 [Lactiplantibacillus plantarum]|nr:hypothetical protein WP50_39025 [Lactiplantibacillus plantarum]